MKVLIKLAIVLSFFNVSNLFAKSKISNSAIKKINLAYIVYLGREAKPSEIKSQLKASFSKITKNLMSGIEFENVKQKRIQSYYIFDFDVPQITMNIPTPKLNDPNQTMISLTEIPNVEQWWKDKSKKIHGGKACWIYDHDEKCLAAHIFRQISGSFDAKWIQNKSFKNYNYSQILNEISKSLNLI